MFIEYSIVVLSIPVPLSVWLHVTVIVFVVDTAVGASFPGAVLSSHIAYKFTIPDCLLVRFFTVSAGWYPVPVPFAKVFHSLKVNPSGAVNPFALSVTSSSYLHVVFEVVPVPPFAL